MQHDPVQNYAHLTEREELIAQRAAEIAIERVAAEIGKKVMAGAGGFMARVVVWVGMAALAAYSFYHGKS